MKVGDIRALAEKSTQKNLIETLVTVYKALPKAKKEELDPLIPDLLQGTPHTQKKEPDLPDMEILHPEIQTFLMEANSGWYFQPNRIVPKAQRSKWRSIVRDYLKKLDLVPEGTDDYKTATRDLVGIYRVLCEGCKTYLFSTNDTFASLRMRQSDLYTDILHHVLAGGHTNTNFHEAIDLACLPVSSENLAWNQLYVFYKAMETEADQILAREVAESMIKENREKLPRYKNSNLTYYELLETIQNLDELYLWLSIALGEHDNKTYRTYFQNMQEYRKDEVLSNGMTDLPGELKTPEVLTGIYHYAVKTLKVKPNQRLEDLIEKAKQKQEPDTHQQSQE